MEANAEKHNFPIIGPACGYYCYQLARMIGAKSIFELGSGYGYSTAWFSKAVQENGGGVVHHTVWDEELSENAASHLLKLGFADMVQYHVAEAVESLRQEAVRKGLSVAELAQKTAKQWTDGLAEWGQTPDRIRRLREAVDVAVYTPGSNVGLPLTILRSFSAPAKEVLENAELLRDRIQATVSGLLSLVGVTGDPLRSREHILLSTILDKAWREGRDVDLGAVIRGIQQPPFDKVGFLDLESFYPAKERFELAMALNNLIASPGFAAWREGEPLDIGRLLHTEAGKPRLSILSVAHLSDDERMFFVTLLLNEVVSWMRTQSGTTSLRAILYMDDPRRM